MGDLVASLLPASMHAESSLIRIGIHIGFAREGRLARIDQTCITQPIKL